VFQTNPRGVEEYNRCWNGTTTGFRRTLVGLKTVPPLVLLPSSSFQTNPRGVEEGDGRQVPRVNVRFRRTLVGLKNKKRGRLAGVSVFQTNPRGVEEVVIDGSVIRSGRFQTNPRGVEDGAKSSLQAGHRRFQTNPRGVEEISSITRCPVLSNCFRRTLVGLKRRLGEVSRHDRVVSDEPSWG